VERTVSARTIRLTLGDRIYEVRLEGPDASGVIALSGSRKAADGPVETLDGLRAQAAVTSGSVALTVDDEPVRCAVARDSRGVWVGWRGRTFYLETGGGARVRPAAEFSRDEVRAPMTGVLVEVRTSPGADVARDDTLAVLEAMKMEYRLTAPRDGRVLEVRQRQGERVELGSVVVRLEPESDGHPAQPADSAPGREGRSRAAAGAGS
jgi:acetyl/propionyl-CoA carboxylase alpha subunit